MFRTVKYVFEERSCWLETFAGNAQWLHPGIQQTAVTSDMTEQSAAVLLYLIVIGSLDLVNRTSRLNVDKSHLFIFTKSIS